MIIDEIEVVPAGDIRRFAWAGLNRFQNVAYVKSMLCELHGLSRRQEPNALKQAQQIRHCLIQAREYNEAAERVSLATRPLLLYYSIMSLGLAEVLLKQDGMSSLDKARGQHAHHGFSLGGASQVAPEEPLEVAATKLKAVPLEHANLQRFGTFELWHRSARELPLGAEITRTYANGTKQSGFGRMVVPSDERYPLLPASGYSLLDCYKSIPSMMYFLLKQDIVPELARTTLRLEIRGEQRELDAQIAIHPAPHSSLEQVYEKISVQPSGWEQLTVKEVASGCIIRWFEKPDFSPVGVRLPNGAQVSRHRAVFCAKNESLNEFGLYYVAMYILGNYARYFPDKWMLDVERASPLALSAMELIASCEERAPLLALAELSRTALVPE